MLFLSGQSSGWPYCLFQASLPFLKSPFLGWELILSWALRATILATVLFFFSASLMPCCSCSFLVCICCSLDMEFHTALGYFLHSIFPMKATTFNFGGWPLVLAIWTDCWVALLWHLLAKVRHSCNKIHAILLWLGPDNIDHCLQLSALDSLEKVVDLDAIVHWTVTIMCNAFHYCVLFLVDCDILSLSHSYLLPSY